MQNTSFTVSQVLTAIFTQFGNLMEQTPSYSVL